MVAPAGTAAQSGRLGLAATGAPSRPATATWIVANTGGDGYWRAEAPARVLGGKTIAIPEKLMRRAFTQPNSSTPLPWRIELETSDGTTHTFSTMKAWRAFTATRPHIRPDTAHSVFPTVEGTVVWQRPDLARAGISLAMQDSGVRTVGECDDNYFADPRQNLFLRHHSFSEADRTHHARAMALQNACVFSTVALRDIYHRELRARVPRRMIPDLHVCRNHVPRADWPERVERDGPLSVGFMGSPSHVWDLAALGPEPFRIAREMGCEVIFVGYNPADPDANSSGWDPGDEHRSERSLRERDRWKPVVSRHIPWVKPDEYHRAVLPLDIGLAPLRTDGFTVGKSDVKAIEFAISGVAAVLQNCPVYNSAGWKHMENCILASTMEDFARAIITLSRDPKLRYELVSAAQEYVASERSDDAIRREWEAVL